MIPLPSLSLHVLPNGEFQLRANDGDWYLRATFPALRSAIVLKGRTALEAVGRS